MTFRDLNLKKPLWNALDDLGYETPTTIQAASFNVMMSGKDTIGIAQTGTGKTLAYLLPSLCMWKFSKEPHPQILIIVPTRELVAQVVSEVEKLSTYMNLAVGGVYGGTNMNTQAAMVLLGLDVLVGTPGRILDLAANGSLQLKHAKKVIIDEVDETLSLGFRPQLLRIFEYLPAKRQNMVFSATLSEEVSLFLDDYLTTPVRVEAARAGSSLDKIDQAAFRVPNFLSKVSLLHHLLENEAENSKVLVFVSSRTLADTLFEEMEQTLGDSVGVIHSNKAQNFRFNTVQNFQTGDINVLIATDLIARGIDVTDVSHVINFDIPESPENYIHRIGRTGRADKNGVATTFVTEKDETALIAIEALMQKKLSFTDVPSEVDFTEELLEFEKAKVVIPGKLIKLPKRENAGASFHEKKAKNKKVNVRYDHKKAMMDKYGKPKRKRS
ncbi:MAG: DEAD/DEAH box helicase [Crocinitomicaceae bacterium]|jgi:ATP-dependent RNA helicase RhlE|nr:DEAD/DEAH box helicase [Crocinitomicaceae bacterium]MDP4760258.1 DEAD/DEAH box helicase [Crocinitomicaceae bacterium]